MSPTTIAELAGYQPNDKAALTFAVLYGVSAVYHEIQISKTKPQRFTTPLSLGAFMSTAGYITRRIAIPKKSNFLPLWITSQVLILGAGPTYAGADYFVAARLFHFVPHAAPIRPARVVSTFLTFDILAELLLYAGAISMLLAKEKSGGDIGLWILRLAMLIQAVSFMAFVTMVLRFHKTIRRSCLNGGWKQIIWILYGSSVLIIIRSTYHIAETFVPHDATFRTNEVFFLVLEAGIMLINVGMFNFIHPGFLLPSSSKIYLLEDGTRTEGNDYQDTRSMALRIFDPFDFRGMRKRRHERRFKADQSTLQSLPPANVEMQQLTGLRT